MGDAPREVMPLGNGVDRLLARQLGRLIEDFVECDEAGRFEDTALAQELAEERLRRSVPHTHAADKTARTLSPPPARAGGRASDGP